MNEDWLKDIHDKMSDYESDEPRELWDSIRRAKTSASPRPSSDRIFPSAWTWIKRISSAAAIIAIAATAVYHLTLSTPEFPTDTHITSTSTKIQHTTPEAISTTELDTRSSQPLLAATSVTNQTSTLHIVDYTDSIPTSSDSIASQQPTETSQSIDSHQDIDRHTPTSTPKHTPYRNNHIARATTSAGHSSSRLSVGVFTSGEAGSTHNRKSSQIATYAGLGADASGWNDNPMLGIVVYNQGRQVESDVHHHQPIRSGLSFAYRLSPRITLESGISYTKLLSDIREGSNSHFISGEQTLHYVGIPVNLKYRILSWKDFDLYSSAGFMTEKCVSGNSTTDYILDRQVRHTEKESIETKPWQWSINASAGLQYNITSSVGAYAEPGISYYFDDGSSLATIYKDKPLNFNLNIGIRISFDSK